MEYRKPKSEKEIIKSTMKASADLISGTMVADTVLHGGKAGIPGAAYLGWKAGKAIKKAVKNKNKKAIKANEAQDVKNRKRARLASRKLQGPSAGNKGFITGGPLDKFKRRGD